MACALLMCVCVVVSCGVCPAVWWCSLGGHRVPARFEQAEALLDEVLRIVKGHQQARMLRARIRLLRGRFQLARRDCKALLRQPLSADLSKRVGTTKGFISSLLGLACVRAVAAQSLPRYPWAGVLSVVPE